MTTKVTMPQLGESVVEATVGKWLVKEGDWVAKDQPLVELLTDKADSEIPAPAAGAVSAIRAAEDATVSVGDTLCEIDESASAPAEKGSNREACSDSESEVSEPKKPEPGTAYQGEPPDPSSGRASPAVRKLARDHDVELGQVEATGDGDRITREDVLRAAGKGSADKSSESQANGDRSEASGPRTLRPPAPAPGKRTGAFQPPPYVKRPGDEIVPFSRRRRIIADHMVYSKQVSPDVVTLAECDLHRTAILRDQHKRQLKKEGINLSFLSFVAVATCRALRERPELNARVLDDAYVLLRDVNLGIAVDTPSGLVVPVIPHADELSLRGLARAIDELAERARSGKLSPDDLANKTFTISNPGRQGNLVGGAIISQPNVGILRMGTIKKRVVVVEKDGEDLMAIHPVMHMALTYDHRIVDGVAANSFLFRVCEMLEQADFNV